MVNDMFLIDKQFRYYENNVIFGIIVNVLLCLKSHILFI